jgi:uncharacterized protein
VDSQALGEVARHHGIALVIRFGSTVSGQTHPASDIDLGVLFERLPRTRDEELRTIADLQALECGGPVDVAVLNRADPLLLKQATDHARLEYGTEERFDAFRRYAFMRYHDHRRFSTWNASTSSGSLPRGADDGRHRAGDTQAPADRRRFSIRCG